MTTRARSHSPARALVFAAILFAPAAASADPPTADPPADDEDTRRYCEEQRWREHCRPGSRAGCFPDERCRVYEENLQREREGSQGR